MYFGGRRFVMNVDTSLLLKNKHDITKLCELLTDIVCLSVAYFVGGGGGKLVALSLSLLHCTLLPELPWKCLSIHNCYSQTNITAYNSMNLKWTLFAKVCHCGTYFCCCHCIQWKATAKRTTDLVLCSNPVRRGGCGRKKKERGGGDYKRHDLYLYKILFKNKNEKMS